MKLSAPCYAQDFSVSDIDGLRFQLSDYQGKPIVLSFFRDVSCLFSDARLIELSAKYQEWAALGIEIVVVFGSYNEDIKHFISDYSLPFRVIGDPELKLYEQYAIERSTTGLLKALLFNFPRVARGLMTDRKVDLCHSTGKLMPADFLIGPTGKILDLWYGRNAASHIPMKRLDMFAAKVKKAKEMLSLTEHDVKLAQQKMLVDQQIEKEFSEKLNEIKATLLNKELSQISEQQYEEAKAA